MTTVPNDLAYLDGTASDQLAALIFELASQLHVERQHRFALEVLLQRAGVLEAGALDRLADDDEVNAISRRVLDTSMRRLLRVVCESGDPRRPLGGEAT